MDWRDHGPSTHFRNELITKESDHELLYYFDEEECEDMVVLPTEEVPPQHISQQEDCEQFPLCADYSETCELDRISSALQLLNQPQHTIVNDTKHSLGDAYLKNSVVTNANPRITDETSKNSPHIDGTPKNLFFTDANLRSSFNSVSSPSCGSSSVMESTTTTDIEQYFAPVLKHACCQTDHVYISEDPPSSSESEYNIEDDLPVVVNRRRTRQSSSLSDDDSLVCEEPPKKKRRILKKDDNFEAPSQKLEFDKIGLKPSRMKQVQVASSGIWPKFLTSTPHKYQMIILYNSSVKDHPELPDIYLLDENEEDVSEYLIVRPQRTLCGFSDTKNCHIHAVSLEFKTTSFKSRTKYLLSIPLLDWTSNSFRLVARRNEEEKSFWNNLEDTDGSFDSLCVRRCVSVENIEYY